MVTLQSTASGAATVVATASVKANISRLHLTAATESRVFKATSTITACVLLAIAAPEGHTQESVDARVKQLEATVHTLERRVAALEAQLQARGASVRAPAGKESWRKLQKGMSPKEVEALLGSPTKIDVYGVMTIWRYGAGQVRFDGETNAVDAWFEP